MWNFNYGLATLRASDRVNNSHVSTNKYVHTIFSSGVIITDYPVIHNEPSVTSTKKIGTREENKLFVSDQEHNEREKERTHLCLGEPKKR